MAGGSASSRAFRMMHAAINVLGLPSFHQGGAGFYTATLIRGLVASPELRVSVLGSTRLISELDDVASAADLIAVPERTSPVIRRGLDAAASLRDPRQFHPYRGFEDTIRNADLVHYPLAYMSGPVHRHPTVITAVDLQHEDLPGNFSRKDRFLRRMRWHRAWRAADRVIVFSSFVRKRLAEMGVRCEAVDIVHAACHAAFYETPKLTPPQGRYLLYPASPLPHKDHATLLKAFAVVALEHPDVRLVLTGPLGHDWTSVRDAVSRGGIGSQVEIAGHLGLAELRAYYAGAEALAFPSHYEGFGIPVLEALAAECLVVAADAASLPELAAGHGLLFAPGSAPDLARSLRLVLGMTSAERTRRVTAGRRLADTLTSRRMVELTLGSYRRALDAGESRRPATTSQRRPRP